MTHKHVNKVQARIFKCVSVLICDFVCVFEVLQYLTLDLINIVLIVITLKHFYSRATLSVCPSNSSANLHLIMRVN